MGKVIRKRYSHDFNARVVSEAIKGEQTLAELGAKHWVHQAMIAARNSMETDFCIEALEEAMARHGVPAIVNTDQGSQLTSPRLAGMLEAAGIRISMDGRGRWMDNVLIERLWRSLKYECIYLHAFETGGEQRARLTDWIGHHNTARPH